MASPKGLVASFLGQVSTQYGLSLDDASLDCRWCRFRVSLDKTVSLARRLGLPRTLAFVAAGALVHSIFCGRPRGN